ncbi:cordon-bleu protein-like 1 isoform X1, partial [Lates japonicus]
MDEQVNPLERDHSLSVVLPGGLEKNATVHGSKPVMDLLVTLCASYHLNPSDYTVEVLSPNKNNISFKPNSPIGSLEAEKIVLKPKGVEEKIRRPYMPEATVRLLINYNKSHKAVVRVNPRMPLEMLLPVVCDKCEFQVETTLLLRDSQSKEPLDLSKTLNEHGLREVFAKDTACKEPADHQHQPRTPEAAVTPTEVISAPALQDLPKKEKKQKENTGFLSLFRRRKKKPEMEGAVSAPTSPEHSKQMAVSMDVQGVSSCNKLAADMPKKRRAPQPPMGVSQSVPNNLSTCHLREPQRPAESTLRSTKRRAPPPPCADTHQELQADTQVKGTLVKRLRNSATFPKFYNGSSFMSMTQGGSDNGVFCAELESVLKSNLPTESEWEDPLQRKGMTTFKVVPTMKQKSHDPELTLDVPDQCQATVEDNPESEASPEAQNNQTETEEDPHSPDRSDTETPSSEASPEAQNNQTETGEDPHTPDRPDTETPLPSQEIQASGGPDSPPPPHDLDNQDCTVSPPPEVGDNDEGEKEEEDEPEVTAEVTAAVVSDHSDEELTTD